MNIRTIVVFVFVVALLATFDYLEAWTKPTVLAPGGNVAAPLNTSNTTQDKLGVLGVSALGVNSNGPRILFSDATSNDWWIHTNETTTGLNIMYFLNDRNDDGVWTAENPWPLVLATDPSDGTSNTDFARFSNQVRANEYCDYNGNNCFSGSDVTMLPQCATGETLIADNTGAWTCGSAGSTPPPPTNYLHNNQHTETQCTNNSGTVVTVNGVKICRFNRASCPSGWAPYLAWTTTTGLTCSAACGGKCTAPGHSWADLGVASCVYQTGGGGQSGCSGTAVCKATATQRGCY